MFRTYKVMLIPNNKQSTKMFDTVGACRFVYNWALAKEKEYYNNNKELLSDNELKKQFTLLKQKEEYKWLYNYSNQALKQSIIDVWNNFRKFIKGLCNEPKFKKKNKCKISFYCRTDGIEFSHKSVKLEKLSLSQRTSRRKFNWVKLAEKDRIPIGVRYYNPRVTFDGLNWWISVEVEKEITKTSTSSYSEGIGIDLGIKTLMTCSDGNTYSNAIKTKKYKKLEQRKILLQKAVSKKYVCNKKEDNYIKTKNIKKLEIRILKLDRRLTNLRTNNLYKSINDIISRKPRFINIEDLTVEEMLKDHNLAKRISESSFYKIKTILSYKCEEQGISLRLINKWFASSQICSRCGNVKKDLKLEDRIYTCNCCGLNIDRDYNASINILNYKF